MTCGEEDTPYLEEEKQEEVSKSPQEYATVGSIGDRITQMR